jgi:hypothetical protein
MAQEASTMILDRRWRVLDTARVPAKASADQDETQNQSDNERDGVSGIKGSNTLSLKKKAKEGKAEGLGGEGLLSHSNNYKTDLKVKIFNYLIIIKIMKVHHSCAKSSLINEWLFDDKFWQMLSVERKTEEANDFFNDENFPVQVIKNSQDIYLSQLRERQRGARS